MRLFYPLSLAIAIKYGFKSKAHKFASFVAILSTIGIAIGVAALIVDTSIMQGLENRLKGAVLNDTPHVIVQANASDTQELLKLKHVIALAPFVQSQTLMQGPKSLALIKLQGIDENKILLNKGTTKDKLHLVKISSKGSFILNAEASLYIKNEMKLNTKVRLISTVNARYTPMGLTPTQRLFVMRDYYPSTSSASLDSAIGNYDDVRRLLRLPEAISSYRLWLDDPFTIDKVSKQLQQKGYKFTDWRSEQGEFFKAVAMEKLTMSIMLCLVIIVASFNILSALTMMVSARLTEIAILKTLGLTNKKILSIFMMMGIFSGVIGTIVGLIIGIPLTYYISLTMSNTGNFGQLPVSIETFNISIIALGSLLMSLICTLYPAIKASSTDPVTNLCRG